MQQRLVSLERLVSMGLSPQAARAALQHLDEWLVSDVGAAEMSTAEATAQAAGEYILHVGDRVRLDGLVKNAAANGTSGMLQQYVAESQRWKVSLDTGKTFLLQSKFLQPLATRPDSKLEQLKEQCKVRCLQSDPTTEGNAAALASGWKSLEASQAAWKEAQQVMQVKLLEREEALRRGQEDLERQQQQLGEHRRSIALDQARGLKALEQRSAMLQLQEPRRPSAHFEMSDDSPVKSSSTAEPVQEMPVTEDDDDSEGEGEDADEVWDMDWSAVAQQRAGSPVGSQDVVSPVSIGHMTPSTAPQVAASTPAPADVAAAAEVPLLPAAAPSEREELQRKLEEKRRLAELHNGEDHTAAPRGVVMKESMPGAHPSLAEKLEQRRKSLDADPDATLAPPDTSVEEAADEAF